MQNRCQFWIIIAILNPKEIAENIKFDNITQVWLGGDHYKWRLMRSNGVDEYYITGGASDWENLKNGQKH